MENTEKAKLQKGLIEKYKSC